ncbi:tRNA-splicing endonuclease subunit Sen54 isoform X1 [Megalobrama amblycephala]|uniref:tRNA-splicing endonuclease subunit Sen54 isoform X1 n=1 Tax=Megalobrama amblycephala TaxID=75352 RepID=UPI002013E1E3|nr:tRNA-splicing endonuclease subunit Sen54 isoform X1 [Megalobrama amblycephala]
MADSDTSTDAHKLNVYQELLSPSELFEARSRSHKIPVRGQKDFLPDGSEKQTARLQQSLDEHWTLLAEERVERLGNLVKAVWIPEETLVELQSPAGKFWQTMGFSERGKQYLHPEEALYLMECGNVQVFHRDLPLSIQEGYERFLSCETVTLHQYQVFGHLKRLGYVVNRFDPSSVPSTYERQLNLPASSRDKQRKQLKRKRSQSPVSSEKQNTSPVEKITAEDQSDELVKNSESPAATDLPPQEPMQSAEASDRTWWIEGDVHPPPAQAQSTAPRWDFSSISFPDLGSRRSRSVCLASPDRSLLPGALEVGDCDVTPWLSRLNVKQEKLSRRDRERQRERDRYRRDVNSDREVRRCRNWAEYLQLLEERRRRRQKDRPAHLWEREVTPLTQPGQCASHRELLDQISIVKSSSLSEGVSRLSPSDQWKISFDVYQPDTVAEFKKSHPGKPYSRMCVCSFDGPVPDLHVMKQLSFQSGDVPVTFAVVDHGDISFYCFKDFKLPTDVY